MIDIPVPTVEKYDTLLDAIETSIDGELEAVELYRRIKAMLPTMQMQDTLYEIITDEQEHATRFVYLYAMEK
jgi:rubrerythrin